MRNSLVNSTLNNSKIVKNTKFRDSDKRVYKVNIGRGQIDRIW